MLKWLRELFETDTVEIPMTRYEAQWLLEHLRDNKETHQHQNNTELRAKIHKALTTR